MNHYRISGAEDAIREQNMINYVLAGGTLAIVVDASGWSSYKSGIYSGCGLEYEINHGVNIVGVNVTGGYWIIRNTWGVRWGERGYMKLALVRTYHHQNTERLFASILNGHLKLTNTKLRSPSGRRYVRCGQARDLCDGCRLNAVYCTALPAHKKSHYHSKCETN